jgi:hypothetical protein
LWGTVVSLLVHAGCAGDPAPVVSASPASPCVVEQSPLVLTDGTELHLDTQNLFRLGDEWLLSGAPSYQFRVAPGVDAVNVSRHAHVAAFLSRPARAVANPLGTRRLGSVISTPLGDGRWAAIFDEVHPDSMPTVPLAYWYGEHDGTEWSLVEPLPAPPDAELSLRESTALVRIGDRLAWIAYERHEIAPSNLRRYERRDGVWRSEALPDVWVEQVVLQADGASNLWMLLVGPDGDLPGFKKSIRLYREGPPRELVSRVAVVPGSIPEIRHPSLQVRGGAAAVSWVLVSGAGAHAFARVGIDAGQAGETVALDDYALHLYSMTMPDGSLAWVAEHADPEAQRKELRLLRLEGSRAVVTATAPSPFTGFFRAQPSGPNEVLLVGAQMGLVPTETPVRSLILRLSASC